MKIQLWSYNFDPEPTGIGIVSTVWARGLRDRGHDVEVIAAHPHYPEPRWGTRLLPYREVRDGIKVLRLPLWIGRGSAAQRYRQELTFMAAQASVTPFLPRPDVLVSASPSFPALLPAVANVRARKIPWVLWLHDLLPDGATATGLVDEGGAVIKLARRLEAAAYRAADRIVVLSRSFTDNLVAKGVPAQKIELIYDPATRVPDRPPAPPASSGALRILSIGNIGHSQGLTALVRAFEAHPEVPAQLVVTGTGVAADEARAEVRTGRVQMLGLVDDDRLERELHEADIAFVSQRYDGSEFNIPSKLMNFMAYGLPILAAVNPSGEVARIVAESGAGWVVDSSDAESFPRAVTRLGEAHDEVPQRADAALRFTALHAGGLRGAFRTDAAVRQRHRAARPAGVLGQDTSRGQVAERVGGIGDGRYARSRQGCRPVRRALAVSIGSLDTPGLPVTAVLPVLNEEQNLGEALESVRWASEIFVVDSGSTDNTAGIAEAHGATVVQFLHERGGPKKKAWSLRNLPFSNDWALYLDGDERIPNDLKAEIREVVNAPEHDGYYLDREFIFRGKELRSYRPDWNLRLFRHKLASVEDLGLHHLDGTGDNEIHEHFILDGTTGFLTHPLLHDDYRGIGPWIERHNKYATWEAHLYRRLRGEPVSFTVSALRDPTYRNRVLRRIWVRLPGRPLIRFVAWYVGKRAIMDGWNGFQYAFLMAWYEFVISVKVRELERL